MLCRKKQLTVIVADSVNKIQADGIIFCSNWDEFDMKMKTSSLFAEGEPLQPDKAKQTNVEQCAMISHISRSRFKRSCDKMLLTESECP